MRTNDARFGFAIWKTKFDAPPVWVYTRWPGELLFYSDVKFAVRASVNAYPRAMSQLPNYEIRYALEPPWTWATGYANSLEEATLMVLHALQHSYKNGQQTKKRYRTRTKKAP